MTKTLAYCCFLHAPEIALPAEGVGGAPVEVLSKDDLRILFSQVSWPPPAEAMQRSAIEFHSVITHIFRQTAVVPFRLLSVFESRESLEEFFESQHQAFHQDLLRLKDLVQMETVIYLGGEELRRGALSGRSYLQQKAESLRSLEQYVSGVRLSLEGLARDLRVREVRTGSRVFVLVERGQESHFTNLVQSVAVPEGLSRRISGPWPAAEFISQSLREPPAAGNQ